MKIVGSVAFFLLATCTQASANGNLYSIIIELENLKGMVALQKQKEATQDERWVFRYDLLENRIDHIIVDIEKHISLKQQLPKLHPIDLTISPSDPLLANDGT